MRTKQNSWKENVCDLKTHLGFLTIISDQHLGCIASPDDGDRFNYSFQKGIDEKKCRSREKERGVSLDALFLQRANKDSKGPNHFILCYYHSRFN